MEQSQKTLTKFRCEGVDVFTYKYTLPVGAKTNTTEYNQKLK